MAQLGNLLVKGSSRFLNKAYFEDVSICGDVSIGGKLDITANEGKSILSLNGKKALEVYDTWLNINESRDFPSGIYCGTGVLRTDGEFQVSNIKTGVKFKVNNSSLASYVPSTFSAQATFNGGLIASSANISEEICNTLIVKDELRSAKWNIDNITNLGSTFYVSPCIVFTNPSVYVNSISGTTVILTITDNSITSSTIGGATWTNGSKVKLMGRIGNSALGTINGVLKRDLNSSTAKTAYISLDFPNTDLIKFSAGATYSGSDVGDLKMMMYEVNKNVNGTTKNRPIGILLSSYGENKKPCIDIYNGDIEDGSPVARMGYLNGLPSVNSVSPTGYGFYAAGNAYFSGTLVSTSGKIGGFSLSENSIQNGAFGQSGSVLICTGTNSSASIGGSDSINGWCFTASNTFGVTKTGALYASNATIEGNITATSGKIGGCNISNGLLSITNATSLYAEFDGNGKTNGYFHVATLKIVSSYVNCAMVIGARSRGYGYSEVNIQFENQYGTNPNLDFFNQTGRGDWYIKKTATSTWDVYCKKSEDWGWTEVVKYINNSGVEITWGTGNADLPSDSIRATQLAGSSAWCYNNDSTYIDGGNIYAGTVTADKITTNNISGTNGWINLRSGLFDYGNGKLKWDGTSLSIAGSGTFAGEITATSGKIGGFNIDSTFLQSSDETVGLSATSYNWAFWAGGASMDTAKFRVNQAGKLWASNATIAGEITATSGKIGKYTIDNYLSTGSGYTCTGMGGDQAFWAGSESSNNAPFHVSYDGSFYSSKGIIAGWNIGTDNIYSYLGNNNKTSTITLHSAQSTTAPYITLERNYKFSNGDYSNGKIYIKDEYISFHADIYTQNSEEKYSSELIMRPLGNGIYFWKEGSNMDGDFCYKASYNVDYIELYDSSLKNTKQKITAANLNACHAGLVCRYWNANTSITTNTNNTTWSYVPAFVTTNDNNIMKSEFFSKVNNNQIKILKKGIYQFFVRIACKSSTAFKRALFAPYINNKRYSSYTDNIYSPVVAIYQTLKIYTLELVENDLVDFRAASQESIAVQLQINDINIFVIDYEGKYS